MLCLSGFQFFLLAPQFEQNVAVCSISPLQYWHYFCGYFFLFFPAGEIAYMRMAVKLVYQVLFGLSVLDKIGFFQNRRDEVPNQQLARLRKSPIAKLHG